MPSTFSRSKRPLTLFLKSSALSWKAVSRGGMWSESPTLHPGGDRRDRQEGATMRRYQFQGKNVKQAGPGKSRMSRKAKASLSRFNKTIGVRT